MLDAGSKDSGVVNDGCFICMHWKGASGNHKVEVIVEKGDDRRNKALEDN